MLRWVERVRPCAISSAVILACWLSLSPVAAEGRQGKRDKKGKEFAEAVDVTEVQVPVTVVGKDGLPIRGLRLGDFEVTDNGRRQILSRLETIDLEALEPGATRTEIEGAVPAAARRYFLLLFDHSFANPSSIRNAQKAAREFVVEALHPTDLAAVAVLTPDAGPRLVVTFTPDRAQVARGIDAVASPELLQMARGQDPLRFMIQVPSSTGGSVTARNTPVDDEFTQSAPDEMQSYFEVIGQRMENVERSFDRGQVEGWSSAMAQLGQALGSLRGRKYVVYLSEGFDSELLYGASSMGASPFEGQALTPSEQNLAGVLDSESLYGSGGLRSSVDEMLREFRRADSVIEAVDISAFGEAGAGDSSLGSEGSLFYMANETGGDVYPGGSDLDEQLEVMLRRTALTYLLTFQPTRLKHDGSYHRLKVKAALPAGAKLTHRVGYYAPKPFDELHPIERDLLIADAIAGATPSRDVKVNVLAAPFPANASRAYVPVVLEIAGESLVVGHEEDHLPIEIYAYVSDGTGAMSDFFTQVLTFNLAGRWDAFRSTGLKYYGHVDLDAGNDYLLRVVVRNGLTGRTGVETLPLDVPDYSGPAPVLLPPFVVEPPQRWFMVREKPPEEQDQEWFVYPFTIQGEPFVPAVAPVFRGQEDIQLCLIAYHLGVEDPQLRGRVLTKEGLDIEAGKLTLTDHIIAKQSGVDKLIARFSTAGLAPGQYELRLELLDPSWGEPAYQQIAFTVRD
jgi:VWFA-related protein